MSISVGVAGASGYAGGELLRLIAGHPHLELAVAAAGTGAGALITDIHPGLASLAGQTFAPTSVEHLAQVDVLFVALPHGQSAALTDQLPDHVRVVDLGADRRLRDPAAWNRYYGSAVGGQPWTYGLPELPGRREQIAQATKVACAGCYATAIQLALAPALAAGLIAPSDLVVVAASGTSGAGRKASVALSATQVMGSMSAYKVGGAHQHTAEIEQELTSVAGEQVTLSFTPFLAPMPRGIIATSTAPLRDGVDSEVLLQAYATAYGDEPFVRLLAADQTSDTGAVLGSNSATVQVFADQHAGRAVVVATIDNLVKGAAGQAIQCANIMLGIDEREGLTMNGLTP